MTYVINNELRVQHKTYVAQGYLNLGMAVVVVELQNFTKSSSDFISDRNINQWTSFIKYGHYSILLVLVKETWRLIEATKCWKNVLLSPNRVQ